MNKTAILTLVVMLAVLLCAAGATYYIYTSRGDDKNSDAQRTLSSLEGDAFTNLDGQQMALGEYEGKVRVVNSWASWSPFSAQELRDLEALAKAYADKGVVVIAINRNEPKEQAQHYLSTLGTFSHLHIVLDTKDAYFTSVEGYAMPETLFYDSRGNVHYHKRGNMTKEEMEKLLLETIAATEN
jgi:thiol-disulfide isomerase/thioredoxin